MTDPAISYRFSLNIQGMDLGAFTKLEGLAAKYDVLTVKEGGENAYTHALPGRVEYEPVKLTRPVDEKSGAIAAWFTEFRMSLEYGGKLRRLTAGITAFGPNQTPIANWQLLGVIPVSYSGPTFEAGSSNVLSETLELSHQGFWRT